MQIKISELDVNNFVVGTMFGSNRHGVSITHIPTGIQVIKSENVSGFLNHKEAMRELTKQVSQRLVDKNFRRRYKVLTANIVEFLKACEKECMQVHIEQLNSMWAVVLLSCYELERLQINNVDPELLKTY